MSDFVREAGAAVALVALTLLLQCAGMAAVISFAKPSLAPDGLRLGPLHSALLMVRLMTAFIALHMLEILLWAAFYRWLCFPLLESAFYFSTSSYATVGYGDVILPQRWRALGPVESITGVLMCGLSASFLFAIVSRLVDRETRLSSDLAKTRSSYSEGETIPTI
ncbi:MAG TPA: potassium channel family protein [Candidatus Saccharimonadales bacterium]|nr:potassium channel family protein [Candidatus Saccharimonadales bacterium]